MKKLLGLLCLIAIAFQSFAQNKDGGIAIIPEPVALTKKAGDFTLPKKIVIVSSTQPEMKQVIALLRTRFSVPTGSKVSVVNSAQLATIRLSLNKKADTLLGKEGYRLSVTKKGIFIRANEPAGLFYGAQTLVQLFPKEIVSEAHVSNVKWISPCVDITDYPRFKWRGLMFDVARHFFTKAEVEEYIDNMV
ncbi:MAG TPA: beta-N-acetylhexosaminidase, partial [Mucilaginibacter sp.]